MSKDKRRLPKRKRKKEERGLTLPKVIGLVSLLNLLLRLLEIILRLLGLVK